MAQRWRGGLLWQFAVVSLVVMVILGVALGWLLGYIVERNALADAADEATQTVALRVLRHLSPADFRTPMRDQRYADFQRFAQESVISGHTARIKLWNPDGTVIFSDDPSQVGQSFPTGAELATALRGEVAMEVSALQGIEHLGERQYGRLLEVYAPVVFPGSPEVAGAFEMYQFYEPYGRTIRSAQRDLYGALAVGLLFLYGALFAVVKRGHDMIGLQQRHLAVLAIEKTSLLATAQERAEALQEAYRATLEALSAALDLRDGETESHSLRSAQRTRLLAEALGVPAEQQEALVTGALLHDVGKIGVPDAILRKPGALTPEEWALMRQHPRLGYQMLAPILFLAQAAPIICHHHERYGGAGYPEGLRGAEIPLGARIFAVVDAYDAITSDRPYRKARTHRDAVAEIARSAGTQFDPQVVAAFLRICDQFAEPAAPIPASPVSPALGAAGAVRAVPSPA